MKKSLYFLFSPMLILLIHGCTKADEWLDIKGNNADVILSNLKDYQAVLDNDDIMNISLPTLGLLSSDSYYYTDAIYAARTVTERNSYVWAKDVFSGANSNDWGQPYSQIAQANIVLEGINKITINDNNRVDWNRVRGSALFYRSFSLYLMMQVFAPEYAEATAMTDMGLPIKTDSYIHATVTRNSVKECYEQITKDLEESLNLLPATPLYKTRPSKPAVFGLLSRVWLHRGDYTKAMSYADSALKYNSSLLDLNTLNATPTYSFPSFQAGNTEIIFYAAGATYSGLSNAFADSILYKSYASNDLRKTLFYKLSGGIAQFKGSYTASNAPFAGIAVNELMLIRAETRARTGDLTGALADLNTLLAKRWKTGNYLNQNASTPVAALALIIAERRKELSFSGGARWEDLRRLNREPAYAQTIKRVIAGVEYTLAPNDNKYTLPIPDNEIRLSGITQNPR
jgi:hypothetical protein